jgi:hypothetical protein
MACYGDSFTSLFFTSLYSLKITTAHGKSHSVLAITGHSQVVALNNEHSSASVLDSKPFKTDSWSIRLGKLLLA